jgi:uroporphyrinogen-III synthase
MAPQHHARPVLLTRPAPQAERFAAELANRFGATLRPVISPLMVPEFFAPEWPDLPYSTLILTSETGAEAAALLREKGRALPERAICVGDRTAEAARGLGFDARSAKGDAEVLIALILESDDPGPFLHLRGREARGDVAPRLAAKGRASHAAIVYAQVAQPLKAEARALLSGDDPVIIPLFSPRSAAILADFGPFAAPLLLVAISPAVAEKAAILAPAQLEVADSPDAAGMLAAIARLIADPAS